MPLLHEGGIALYARCDERSRVRSTDSEQFANETATLACDICFEALDRGVPVRVPEQRRRDLLTRGQRGQDFRDGVSSTTTHTGLFPSKGEFLTALRNRVSGWPKRERAALGGRKAAGH